MNAIISLIVVCCLLGLFLNFVKIRPALERLAIGLLILLIVWVLLHVFGLWPVFQF